MSAALGLLRLQQIDNRIEQAQGQLDRIRAELENDAETAAARGSFEAARAEQEESERNRSEVEQQVSSQRTKLQQAEASLYGGSVRNPKELQDLQADVASLKKHLVKLEETEYEWMEKLESAEQSTRAAQGVLESSLGQRQLAQDRLIQEQSELLHVRQDLAAEREAAAHAVPGEVLEKYETLRRSHRGVAVAEILDGACSACGTTLTAALQQSARHASTFVHCPSCGRILYGG